MNQEKEKFLTKLRRQAEDYGSCQIEIWADGIGKLATGICEARSLMVDENFISIGRPAYSNQEVMFHCRIDLSKDDFKLDDSYPYEIKMDSGITYLIRFRLW